MKTQASVDLQESFNESGSIPISLESEPSCRGIEALVIY